MTRIMPVRNRPAIRMAVASGVGAAQASATEAEASATAAAASASAASGSASAASASAAAALISENAAETAETNAETAETNAEAAQLAAENARDAALLAQTAAETAETNAETAETNAESAQTAAEAARDLAQNYAAALTGTSTTSLSIGTGSKVFTTQSGKQWALGQRLRAASDDGVKVMEGEVTDYTGTSLTIDVDFTEDSGTHADWNIGLAGARGATGAPGSMSGPVSSVVGNIAVFADTGGTEVDDSGSSVSDVLDRTNHTGEQAISTVTGLQTALDGKQPLDDQLTDIAGLTPTDGNFIVGDGTDFVTESGATARASLGLGSAAVLAETTTSEYRSNTADRALSTDQVWAAGAEVTLTDAATVALDMSTFINGVVTLGGNRTLGNPTNEKVGQQGVIRIVQDATGSRTLNYGTDWEFAGGSAPVLSTAASAQDLLFYHVIATNRVFGSLVKAIA